VFSQRDGLGDLGDGQPMGVVTDGATDPNRPDTCAGRSSEARRVLGTRSGWVQAPTQRIQLSEQLLTAMAQAWARVADLLDEGLDARLDGLAVGARGKARGSRGELLAGDLGNRSRDRWRSHLGLVEATLDGDRAELHIVVSAQFLAQRGQGGLDDCPGHLQLDAEL
jgi:hypothetical protein